MQRQGQGRRLLPSRARLTAARKRAVARRLCETMPAQQLLAPSQQLLFRLLPVHLRLSLSPALRLRLSSPLQSRRATLAVPLLRACGPGLRRRPHRRRHRLPHPQLPLRGLLGPPACEAAPLLLPATAATATAPRPPPLVLLAGGQARVAVLVTVPATAAVARRLRMRQRRLIAPPRLQLQLQLPHPCPRLPLQGLQSLQQQGSSRIRLCRREGCGRRPLLQPPSGSAIGPAALAPAPAANQLCRRLPRSRLASHRAARKLTCTCLPTQRRLACLHWPCEAHRPPPLPPLHRLGLTEGAAEAQALRPCLCLPLPLLRRPLRRPPHWRQAAPSALLALHPSSS